MIALDTNILVYAHRPEGLSHGRAARVVAGLAEIREAWAIPFHCLVEFAAIVSNPRIFAEPSTATDIEAQITAWRGSQSLQILVDDVPALELLLNLGLKSHVHGGRWHDMRIAACCLAHGVRELWTADRDFSSFPDLKTRNPLVS